MITKVSDCIRRNGRCFCPGYYLGKRTKLSRARKARAQDTADKCRQSRLSTFNADGMNIQRKDNGRSDRVSRGETDESRTDMRCREKEERLFYTNKMSQWLNMRYLGVFLLMQIYLLVEANRFVRVKEKNRIIRSVLGRKSHFL